MNKKRWMTYALAVAIIFASWMIPSNSVEAGVATSVLDSSTLENSAYWNNVSEDVVVEGSKLIFPRESSDYTRFITKVAAKADAYFDNLLELQGKLKFTKLPAGQKFAVAFGLGGIETGMGESGNVEVVFTNENGIKIEVVAYEEDGSEVVVCEKKSAGFSLNSVVNVKAQISTEGIITVSLNGKKTCIGLLPVSGEGRVGFIQTGECGAEMDGLVVTLYKYDRPENMNVKEDFEKEAMDISGLGAKAISFLNYRPRSMSIVDYEGNRVLKMENTSVAYVGTKYEYSNFELTFDIPYLQTKNICNDLGYISSARTEQFGISFGGDKSEWDAKGFENATDMVVFDKQKIYSRNWKDEHFAEHEYWQDEKPISVKLSAIDGVITVGMKYMQDKDYNTVFSYRLDGGASTGYVHLWMHTAANMAIDNFEIKNLDDNPKLIQSEYKSGMITAEDAGYIPFERVYAPTEDTKVPVYQELWEQYSWYLMIPVVSLLGLLAIGVTCVVMNQKRKKEQEVSLNEHEI